MEKAVKYFEEQLVGIHFGIPTVGLIDTVKVSYHGQATPIKYLASTTKGEGRIKIEPHDVSILGAIEKALKASGFNAYVFSKTSVVVSLPKIANASEREKVVSQIRKLEEDAKIAVRNIRKKARQHTSLSKDEQIKFEKELQEKTDEYVGIITKIADRKVATLLR